MLRSQWIKTRNQPQGKNSKHSNTCRLNNILLNNEWVNNEIKEEINKYLETNENEHTTAQNLWDIVKAALRGKSIEIQAYLKKTEKAPINNLTLYLQELEEQNKAQSEYKEGNNQDQGKIKEHRD